MILPPQLAEVQFAFVISLVDITGRLIFSFLQEDDKINKSMIINPTIL
jgi:hypothetical protein